MVAHDRIRPLPRLLTSQMITDDLGDPLPALSDLWQRLP